MKIIKHGNPDYLKAPVKFVCDKCKCEFEADNTEYKMRTFDYNGDLCYAINCPECDHVVKAEVPHK